MRGTITEFGNDGACTDNAVINFFPTNFSACDRLMQTKFISSSGFWIILCHNMTIWFFFFYQKQNRKKYLFEDLRYQSAYFGWQVIKAIFDSKNERNSQHFFCCDVKWRYHGGSSSSLLINKLLSPVSILIQILISTIEQTDDICSGSLQLMSRSQRWIFGSQPNPLKEAKNFFIDFLQRKIQFEWAHIEHI